MPVLPLTSVIQMPTQNGLDAMKALSKMPQDNQFERQVAMLKKHEDAVDGKAPAPEQKTTGEGVVGTGDQDVLA